MAAVAARLAAADAAIVNLESPLARSPRTSRGAYDLAGDPAAAAFLSEAGVDVVTVANNHTTDNGSAGVAETLSAVREFGLLAVGAGADVASATQPALLEVGGVRLAVLAFDGTGLGVPAGPSWAGIARYDRETARHLLAALEGRADVRAVSLHWGLEDAVVPNQTQRTVAAELVAAGADLIVGHHPHVVQPVEWLARPGRPPALIAWSVGNLLFDALEPDRQRGMILETFLTRSGVRAFRAVATYTDWRGAVLREGEDAGAALEARLQPHGAPWPSARGRDGERWWLPPCFAEPLVTTAAEAERAWPGLAGCLADAARAPSGTARGVPPGAALDRPR